MLLSALLSWGCVSCAINETNPLTLDFTNDELNLLISSIGIALNLMAESQMTYERTPLAAAMWTQMDQMLALQQKIMAARDKMAVS